MSVTANGPGSATPMPHSRSVEEERAASSFTMPTITERRLALVASVDFDSCCLMTSPTRLTSAARSAAGLDADTDRAAAVGVQLEDDRRLATRLSTFSLRETISPMDSRSEVMLATVCGLRETCSTMSFLEMEPVGG